MDTFRGWPEEAHEPTDVGRRRRHVPLGHVQRHAALPRVPDARVNLEVRARGAKYVEPAEFRTEFRDGPAHASAPEATAQLDPGVHTELAVHVLQGGLDSTDAGEQRRGDLA